MASLAKTKGTRGTHWRVDFFLGDDPKRNHIRIGKMSEPQAITIRSRIEYLIAAKENGVAPDAETSRWAASIGDDLHSKLAKHCLLQPRGKVEITTLGAFLDSYIVKRVDVKGSTATVFGHTRRCLIEYFGTNRPLTEITSGDAKDWRRWLALSEKEGGQELADNTVRRRCGIARQFFTDAVERRLIAENPFAKMKGVAVRANKSRDYFVTRVETQAVLDACPNNEWRLIFALSRYGGLRCPSEHLELRWRDVDWDRDRMVIHAPKTEHHEGKEMRTIPIFPELRPYLETAWDEAAEGAEFVICRYRDTNANLRTQLCRIIKKAKLKPWPKLFHNLRATRETELAEDFPIHVVCDWIGNGQLVAAKHYLQVTNDHFAKAQHQAQQQALQDGGTDRQDEEQERENTEEFDDSPFSLVAELGDAGLEPATSTL
jgi:integrase